MAHNLALGAHGEDLAVQYLTDIGMQIVCRNWRCRYGEIDVIALDDRTIVVVEVKTRSGRGYGGPIEAVTWDKQRRLRRLATLWLAEQGGPWVDVRFDVVAIVIERGADPSIEHRAGVF